MINRDYMKNIGKKRRKGQAGIEFLILISFLLFIFSTYYISLLKKDQEYFTNTVAYDGEALASTISMVLDTTFVEGNGFSINITLPTDIEGLKYTVTIYPNIVSINVGNKHYYHNTIVRKVLGNFTPGINVVKNVHGSIQITNG